MLYWVIDGRALLPMFPIKPLPWLLVVLLCWQAVAAVAAPVMMPAGSPGTAVAEHPMATPADDCGHAQPRHCAESGHAAAGADHCGQPQCKHCPGSVTGTLLTLLPVIPMRATSCQPSFTQLPSSSRQPRVAYRPPIAA
ncbi:MAG: hypothetical protein AB7I68_12790 [Porticoccaceae bacterium]